MSVLIVEDEYILAEIIKRFLSEGNIQSDIAINAKEALEKLQSPYDAVLCDIDLPDGDGFEIISQCRDLQSQNCMLVAMSGNPQEALDYQCYKFGVEHFIDKPFKKSQLLDIFASLSKSAA